MAAESLGQLGGPRSDHMPPCDTTGARWMAVLMQEVEWGAAGGQ